MSFPFELPSKETVSREVYERDESVFQTQTQISLDEVVSLVPEMSKSQPIIITKNDNIQRRVGQIETLLAENNHIFLTAKSSGVNKLISIVEIVKKNNQSVVQCNKLSSVKSTTNPNYTHSKSTESQKNNVHRFVNDPGVEADSIRKEIRGAKIYELPVLSIVLMSQTPEDPSKLELKGWTLN